MVLFDVFLRENEAEIFEFLILIMERDCVIKILIIMIDIFD
jgi:hypothetical protein